MTLGLRALSQVKAEKKRTSGRQYCGREKGVGREIIGERQGLGSEII